MYILSQIFIGMADVFYVGSMLQKKKIGLILLLLFSDILVAVHYFCLGAITGSVVIFVDAAFLVASYILEKCKKEKYTIIAVVIAMIAIIISTIFTWAGPISLLPMFAILTYLVGMIFKNVVFVKVGAMVRNLLNVIYMVIITSYFGAILEFCLMISAVIGIFINIKKKKEIKE